MTLYRCVMLCAVAATVVGCNKNEGAITSSIPPTGAFRYINAVPDTGPLDYRPVDAVEYSPNMSVAAFRSFAPYQAMAPGSRHIRVFMSSTDPAIASIVMFDTTFAVAAGVYYTFLHYGFARTGQAPAAGVIITTDTIPDPAAAGQVALRLIHAAAGIGNVDIFVGPKAAGLPASPTYTNVPFLGITTYNAIAADTTVKRVWVTATGTTTPFLVALDAPKGTPGTTGQSATEPVPGTQVAGTVYSVILVARSVAGSTAPQTFTTPSLILPIDRRPPPTY